MSDLFKGLYRVQSTRAPWWDYSWNGVYFVTICTKNRQHFFGHIENGKMILSPIGIIADILWYEIKNHAQHVETGPFVVMPNHIHGIIILNNPENANEETYPSPGFRFHMATSFPRSHYSSSRFI